MLKLAASDDEKLNLNTSSQSLQYQNWYRWMFFLEIILKCLLLNLDFSGSGGPSRRGRCSIDPRDLVQPDMSCDYPVLCYTRPHNIMIAFKKVVLLSQSKYCSRVFCRSAAKKGNLLTQNGSKSVQSDLM